MSAAECQPFAAAVVDRAAPKPAGLAAHLSTCDGCRALVQGHRAAQLLQGAPVFRATRVPVRRVAVRAGLAATVLALAVTGWELSRPDEPAPPPVAVEEPLAPPQEELKPVVAPLPAGVEQAPLVAPAVAEVQPAAAFDSAGAELAALSRTVTHYARSNPVAHGYGPRFKNLPALLAPARSRPLASLESSLSPLVTTPEE